MTGAAKLSQLPADSGIEVAFAGRSNAGKSSAINCLSGRRALARTSRTPGRTQQINFFALPESDPDTRRLVDLPGYGYAKVPMALRKEWEKVLHAYLVSRKCLNGLMLVMDIRHPLSEGDCLILDWASEAQMPVHILLTKADKLKRGQQAKSRLGVAKMLDEQWPGTTVQLFSALKREGVEEARMQLAHWLKWASDPAAPE